MTVGKLDRSKLDEAAELWKAYLSHCEVLGPRMTLTVEQIARQRDVKNQEIEGAVAERKRAVEMRNSDAALIARFAETTVDVQASLDRATKELSEEHSRLVDLKKSKTEGLKRREQAIANAAKQEAEMAALMGKGDMDTPWSSGALPELSTEVKDWVSNFVQVKKEQTIAYFKAESEKFGAVLDVRSIGLEIDACEKRTVELEEQIARNKETLVALRIEKERAEADAPQIIEEILAIQKRIDSFNADLDSLAYAEHLHSVLGAEAERALSAIREVLQEIQEGLSRSLSEIRAIYHPDFPAKIQKEFKAFEQDWIDQDKALKSFKLGKDPDANLVALNRQYDLVQSFATKIDVFVDTQLIKSADEARVRVLAVIRDSFCEEVTKKRNSETGFSIRSNELLISQNVLKGISAKCEPTLPVVPAHLLGPLRDEADAAYSRVETALIEKSLSDEAEKARLAALDAVGKEDEFKTLKSTRRDAAIAAYKSKPKAEATPEIVRTALKDALSLQRRPTHGRWCAILSLPDNTFLTASPFTDSMGNTSVVHVSFFRDCFGPAVKGGIGVYKDDTTKHTAAEVVKKLFEDGVDPPGRVHASIEIYDESGKLKPHFYYGGLNLHFKPVFTHAVLPADPLEQYDKNWISKAKAHAKKALDDQMALVEARVKAWLDSDGAF